LFLNRGYFSAIATGVGLRQKKMALQTILGANGTISRILAKELTAYTNRIRLVSRNPTRVNDTDELFPADLTDAATVEKAVSGSAIVYLMVGFEYKLSVWRAQWPPLMANVIAACKKHNAKLVFFDNMYLYDRSALPHMTEDAVINPPSEKGKVRRDIAAMLMKEAQAGNLQALIARAPDFYGPDNSKSVLIETVFKNMARGKRPMWFVDADKKHSFIYTPDAAKATAMLGNTDTAYNQVWHLPTDSRQITVREITELFNKAMGTTLQLQVLPMAMIKILGIFTPILREMPEMMYQNNTDYFFDSSKFEKAFDFKPTPYEDGVKHVVAG
jgi:nucleoside-diphosphate-sugar epimerase